MDDPLNLKLLMNQSQPDSASTSTNCTRVYKCDICNAIYTDKVYYDLHRQSHQKDEPVVQLVMNPNHQVMPQPVPAHQQQGHTGIIAQEDPLVYKRNYVVEPQQMYAMAPVTQYQVISANNRGAAAVSLPQSHNQHVNIPSYSAPAYILTTDPDGTQQIQPVQDHSIQTQEHHQLQQEHLELPTEHLQPVQQMEELPAQTVIKVSRTPILRKNRPFKCDQCTASFIESSELEEHKSKHTGDGPFTCEDCHFTFMYKSHYRSHKTRCQKKRSQMVSPPAPYVMDSVPVKHRFPKNYIKKTVAQPQPSQQQLSYATSENPSAGSRRNGTARQGTRFNPKNPTFKRTRRGNRVDRPFECDECDASFQNEAELKNHKLKHTGEGPFKCEECKFVFLFKKLYEAHRRRCEKKRREAGGESSGAVSPMSVISSENSINPISSVELPQETEQIQQAQIQLQPQPEVGHINQDNSSYVTLNSPMQVHTISGQPTIIEMRTTQQDVHPIQIPAHSIFDHVMPQTNMIQTTGAGRQELKYELIQTPAVDLEGINVNQIVNLIKVKGVNQ